MGLITMMTTLYALYEYDDYFLLLSSYQNLLPRMMRIRLINPFHQTPHELPQPMLIISLYAASMRLPPKTTQKTHQPRTTHNNNHLPISTALQSSSPPVLLSLLSLSPQQPPPTPPPRTLLLSSPSSSINGPHCLFPWWGSGEWGMGDRLRGHRLQDAPQSTHAPTHPHPHPHPHRGAKQYKPTDQYNITS